MEDKRNFIKELEEENKAKEKPKMLKKSSFKNKKHVLTAIPESKPAEKPISDDDEDEEKDQVEGVDKVPDLPMPHTMFAKPPKRLSGGIKYTKNEEGIHNKLVHSHDPKEWSEAFEEREMIDEKVPIYFSGSKGPVLFCIHGAGHSALSFGPLAIAVKDFARVVSFDLRGHGNHTSEDDFDMQIETLLKDCMNALAYTVNKCEDASIIICGHSLGGALAAKLAYRVIHPEESKETEFEPKHVVGVIVIDVAEGSAISALPFMEQVVDSRPTSFDNMTDVIKFGVTSGQVKRLESACLTMPDLVKEVDGQYVWKNDLLASKDYWREWFTGMNKWFLDVAIPKVLAIASNDRMDKELTIAQMQGKFKLVSMTDVGHTIQEDAPDELAKQIKEFITTFKIREKYNQKLVIVNSAGKEIVIDH